MNETFDRARRVDDFREGATTGGPAGSPTRRRGIDALEAELHSAPDKPRPPKRRLVGNKRAEATYAAELRIWEKDALEAFVRGGAWPRPMHALVANPKGSTGKTPIVVGLAGALAEIRGGSVAAFEAADAPGTLGARAEGTMRSGLKELLSAGPSLTSRAAVDMHGLLQSSNAMIFATKGRRAPWTATDVDTIREILGQYYSITIADSANNDMSVAFAACLKAADALVIPTTLSTDSGTAVANTLKWLEVKDDSGLVPFRPELWERTVIAVTDDGRRPNPRLKARFVNAMREDAQVKVVEIPFDDHLAEGEKIVYAKLAPATQEAFRQLALAVTAAFNDAAVH